MQLDRPLAVITTTIDGDVLALLALKSPSTRLTTGQIQRILGRYTTEGLRKSLTRLVSQGIVYGDAAGRAMTYRLNHDHLAARAIRELADIKGRLRASMADHLLSWGPGLRFAAVFGSAVTGAMRTDSDIDLLVVHDDTSRPGWDEHIADLQIQVHRWTGNTLSTVTMPISELRERHRDPMVQDIRRHGVTVAGDRGWFDRETRTRHAHT